MDEEFHDKAVKYASESPFITFSAYLREALREKMKREDRILQKQN